MDQLKSVRFGAMDTIGYDTVPFGCVLGLESTSIVSSKSFAEGTAAEVAAPAAACSCCEGTTSLEDKYQSISVINVLLWH